MKKYFLSSLEGNESKNILEHSDYIADTVFDVVDREDDVTVEQDGFETSADLSAEELHQINALLAEIGLKASAQDYN